MSNEELKKTPLKDIISDMSRLEQKIYTDIILYNELNAEVIRRFPTDDVRENFKPLTLRTYEREEVKDNVRSKSR